jgi:hypothetical protein
MALKNDNIEGKMPMSLKGVKLLLVGLVVMVAGYILMAGGNSGDPKVFSQDIFDFQRLVAAPLVIICGIVIEVVAIMRVFKEKQ